MIRHFLNFHKGIVNIVLHIIGFTGIFYSIYKLDWRIFAISLVALEFGHIYNHLVGIEKYDMRPKVFFWRLVIFSGLVAILYLVRNLYINPTP